MNEFDLYNFFDVDARNLTDQQVSDRDDALSAGTWSQMEQAVPDIDDQISNLLRNGCTYDGERHNRFLFKKRKPLPRARFVRTNRLL